MDHVADAGAAEYPGVHITAVGSIGTVAVFNAIDGGSDRHADRKTHQCRTCDADTNTG
jgi:hypothetical protein